MPTPDVPDGLNNRLMQLMSFGTWVSSGFIAAGMVLPVSSAGARSEAEQLVSIGIVLLIVLPAVRVATMGTWFLFHGDPDFALIAVLVLAVIIASTLLGAGATHSTSRCGRSGEPVPATTCHWSLDIHPGARVLGNAAALLALGGTSEPRGQKQDKWFRVILEKYGDLPDDAVGAWLQCLSLLRAHQASMGTDMERFWRSSATAR
jgi:hypothetical protein